ncbi:hypothetical protein J6X15_00575 [Candidatus Saccharibacteria bacterium]|nr:hypothetical protein [Candidatus Saccharibacteria bacterium]MBP5656066.1 hypothetical protein [Candidatus Saccharibacteria bacterium]
MEFLAAANTFEMNGTALFLIIVGGIIIWLIMTFLFANMDSGTVDLILNKDKREPKGIEFVDVEDDLQKEKEKAFKEKKKRQRRKELLKRLKITLKKTGVLLLESSWMIGLSVAIILTVYFITQNMLIE